MLAAMLVSYCGTAPQAELQSDSRMTTGEEAEQGDSKTAYYVVGGVIALAAALCTVVPGTRRVCQSADGFAEGIKKKIVKLNEDKAVEGISEDALAKLNDQITKLNKKIGLDADGKALTGDEAVEIKDGFLYKAYDKTIGRLFKKSDDAGKQADESAEAGEGAGKSADDAGKSADDAGKSADDAGKSADDAGKSADDAGKSADADDAGKSADADDAANKKGDEQS